MREKRSAAGDVLVSAGAKLVKDPGRRHKVIEKAIASNLKFEIRESCNCVLVAAAFGDSKFGTSVVNRFWYVNAALAMRASPGFM